MSLPASLTTWGLWQSYAKKHPGIVVAMTFVLLVFPIEKVVTPIYFGKMTQNISNGDKKAWSHMAVVAVMQILVLIMQNVNLVVTRHFQITMHSHVLENVLTYLCETRKCNVSELEVARIVQTIRLYSASVIETVNNWRTQLLPGFFGATGQVIYMFTLDWGLGLIVLFIMLFAAAGTIVNVVMATPVCKQMDQHEVEGYEVLDEILANFETVMNSNECPSEVENLLDHLVELRKLCSQSLAVIVGGSAITSLIIIVLIVVFFYRLYTRFMKMKDKRSVAVSTASTAVVLQLLYVARTIVITVHQLSHLQAASKKSLELLIEWNATELECPEEPTPPSPSSSPLPSPSPSPSHSGAVNSTPGASVTSSVFESPEMVTHVQPGSSKMVTHVQPETRSSFHQLLQKDKPALAFRSVSYTFAPELHPIFDKLNVQIEQGEKVAFTGKNGTGKSTFFRLVIRHIQPTDGSIEFFGVPYRDLSTEFIRQQIGYVQQRVALFNRSIAENILYGSKRSREYLAQRLAEFNLTDYFKRFDDGLDTQVGKRGQKLSGGERQMVHTVRVLLQDPLIYLFDEPTSATDDVTSKMITNIIEQVGRHKTVMVITHDPEVARLMDRTIRLDELVPKRHDR